MPYQVTLRCPSCDHHIANIDQGIVVCELCGWKYEGLERLPTHRAPDNHPWKAGIAAAIRQRDNRYRERAKPIAETTPKINMRVRPEFRDDINWLIENLGWTATEIIEKAVRKYRTTAEREQTLALPAGDDDIDWRFFDNGGDL